jgi:starch phosphorylase
MVLDQLVSGMWSEGDRDLFKPIVDSLLSRDDFMLLADYQAYVDCQRDLGRTYLDKTKWTKMSILNVSRMGYFSSDRSIREYRERIWKTQPVEVKVSDYAQATAELTVSCRLTTD